MLALRLSSALLLRGLLLALMCLARPALAIPAFAEQTGQPCSQCHVGAFGPQLKPYGRDFKLYGYTASDGEHHLPGVALTWQAGLTRTVEPPAAPSGGEPATPDRATTLIWDQQVSAYFGGALGKETGAFAQVTYDGQAAGFMWDNLDLRYAHALHLLGQDSLFGLTLNNAPTVQDAWNSTPQWGFPYNRSSVAQGPAAGALLDGGLSAQALGLGAYVLWNDTVYAELTGYQVLSAALRTRLGTGPSRGGLTDQYDGVVPYLRVAAVRETDDHYLQAGLLALQADRFPGGDRSAGQADRLRDRGVDFNYAWKGSEVHYVSAHGLFLREDATLGASQVLAGTQPSDRLDTWRADVSYSWRDTLTPTVQWFRTRGTPDAAWWGTGSAIPDSAGQVFELAWVPMGKPGSIVPWANARVALQFVRYDRFDGQVPGASSHNTLYLSLWLAASPTYARELAH